MSDFFSAFRGPTGAELDTSRKELLAHFAKIDALREEGFAVCKVCLECFDTDPELAEHDCPRQRAAVEAIQRVIRRRMDAD